MQELLIATGNPGKYKEILGVLEGLPLRLYSLKDLGLSDDGLVEDGDTHSKNALLKAQFFIDKVEIMVLAEDSGIKVDALEDELGVKTRRWGAGENASDKQWLEYFMNRMKNVSLEERGAGFVSNAVLLDPLKGELGNFEGRTKGRIAEKVLVSILPGLPLSSVFIPDGFDGAYAGLTTQDKNKISHRGKAIFEVRKFLER